MPPDLHLCGTLWIRFSSEQARSLGSDVHYNLHVYVLTPAWLKLLVYSSVGGAAHKNIRVYGL